MDTDASPTSDEPPRKRQRVLACRRCRHRKQRCEDERPCNNCRKSGEECVPIEPAPRAPVDVAYVRALEERVAMLEALDPAQADDHMAAKAQQPEPDGNGGPGAPELGLDFQSSTINEGDGSPRGPDATVANTLSPMSDSRRSKASPRVRTGTSPAPLWLDEQLDSAAALFTHEALISPAGSASRIRQQNRPRSADRTTRTLCRETEEALLEAYRDRLQPQYPFLHWPTFMTWYENWKSGRNVGESPEQWKDYFVYLVLSTASLLAPGVPMYHMDSRGLYCDGISLLRSVLVRPDPVLHAQAYLMLCMHALHWSSTQRLISLVSSTMRYCVQRHFHLSETEPRPLTPHLRLESQIKRRCFWSAWGLDRMMAAAFDLPTCLPDAAVSTRLFANIADEDLLAVASRTPIGEELPDAPNFTPISSALHILQCRRIQSEISLYTLRWDYSTQFESSSEWRIRILAELDSYKSRVHAFSDPQSNSHTSHRWLAIVYHYTLLMLYRPTQTSVLGPAGDWSVQASSQACLTFRKFQKDRTIAQTWLALLHQFQAGITLLYCFWATPPELRTASYESPDVSNGLRACSNILAILADRWPKSDCLRDVFELLVREVPLTERPDRPPTRISEVVEADVRERLPEIAIVVAHRPTLRMIEEMISQDFPRCTTGSTLDSQGSNIPAEPVVPGSALDDGSWGSALFEMPFSTDHMYAMEDMGIDQSNNHTSHTPIFPGLF